jgi:uncharacterized protein YndB with AHSA1/START domain
MPTKPIHVSAERTIAAPAGRVYALLADYGEGHPSILPPAIHDLRVVSGGVGAGTIATAVVTLGGRSTPVTLRVSEPEPGRLLRETADENGAVTDFVVDPAPVGSLVRIEMTLPRAGGLRGLVEGLLVPRLFRPVLRDQLERVARATEA